MARRRTEIEISAKDKASAAYKKVKGQSQELEKATGKLRSSYANLGGTIKQFLPMLSGAAIIGGMGKMISMTADAGDKYAKMSQKLGIAVETLSTFDHVAKLSGTTVDAVGVGLRRFAQNAVDMSRGIGEAKREFEVLGIEVTDSSGNIREMEDLLLEVADRFSRMEDGTVKTAMAMRLFGRSGVEMIPMLNQGKEGLRGMMKEAKQLGLVFSEESAKACEKFNDNLTRLQGGMKALAFAVGSKVIPVLSDFTDMILRMAGIERTFNQIRGMTNLIIMWEEKVEGLTAALKKEEEQEWRNENKISDLREQLEFAQQTVIDYTKTLNELKGTVKDIGDGFEDLGEKAGEQTKKTGEAVKEVSDEIETWGERMARAPEWYEPLKQVQDELIERHLALHEIGRTTFHGMSEAAEEAREKNQELSDVVQTMSKAFVMAAFAAAQSGEGIKGMLKSVASALAALSIGKVAEQIAEAFADIAASIWPPNPLAAAAAKAHFAAAAKWGIVGALATAVASMHEGGMILKGHGGIGRIRPDERLLLAQSGEAVLSRRGVEAVGGAAGVGAINRGDVSIAMTNSFGGINNIMDVEEMAAILGNQIVTEIREAK